MADEVIVKVEGETPPVETAPVIVVSEAAPVGSADAIVVFTLEHLAERITQLEAARGGDVATLVALSGEIDSLRSRVGDMEMLKIEDEIEDEIEEEIETETPSEIVAEVIPPEIAEVIVEAAPQQRKRKFI